MKAPKLLNRSHDSSVPYIRIRPPLVTANSQDMVGWGNTPFVSSPCHLLETESSPSQRQQNEPSSWRFCPLTTLKFPNRRHRPLSWVHREEPRHQSHCHHHHETFVPFSMMLLWWLEFLAGRAPCCCVWPVGNTAATKKAATADCRSGSGSASLITFGHCRSWQCCGACFSSLPSLFGRGLVDQFHFLVSFVVLVIIITGLVHRIIDWLTIDCPFWTCKTVTAHCRWRVDFLHIVISVVDNIAVFGALGSCSFLPACPGSHLCCRFYCFRCGLG